MVSLLRGVRFWPAVTLMVGVAVACGGDERTPVPGAQVGQGESQLVTASDDAGVSPDAAREPESAGARRALDQEIGRCASSRAGSLLPSSEAAGFIRDAKGSLEAVIPDGVSRRTRHKGRVRLAAHLDVAAELTELTANSQVALSLVAASNTPAEVAGGFVVYRDTTDAGAHVFRRSSAEGVEDFFVYSRAPAKPQIDYQLELRAGIAGLRLVNDTLEFLDATGLPRLRVGAPRIQTADCEIVSAHLVLAGCAADTSPRVPWGRPITPPGAASCTLSVTWDSAEVRYPALVDPPWVTPGSMNSPRFAFAGVGTSSGDVLVSGASGSPFLVNSAEVLNVLAGTWSYTGSMAAGRSIHTATLLGSGKILVAGGGPNTAELWDPATGLWTSAGTINATNTKINSHTATTLSDGTVLVAGGKNQSAVAVSNVDVYTPATNSWAPKTSMSAPRVGHYAALMANNQVFVVGGDTTKAACELFTPAGSGAGTWAAAAPLPSGRTSFAGAQLSNKDVLITGGIVSSAASSLTHLYSGGAWTAVGSMLTARQSHTAVTLPSGAVLVAGGKDASNTVQVAAEVFNPTPATWSSHASMATARTLHVVVQPRNGYVAEIGGSGQLIGSSLSSAELLDPCGGVVTDDGNSCTIDACDPQAGPQSGVVTHTANSSLVGTYCNGTNACSTTPRTCDAAGKCNAQSATVIDDKNPCTVDACSPTAGVTHTLAAAGTQCGAGSACQAASTCDASGFCVAGAFTGVNDNNPCTVDSCVSGTVTHTPLPDYTSVETDNNVCNGIDTCSGGVKVAGIPWQFNVASTDGCTETFCDPSFGLYHGTPLPPLPPPPSYCGTTGALPGIPPGDPTVATDPAGSTTWIYGGTNPIQCAQLAANGTCTTTLNPAVFIAGQVGIIRGKVFDGGTMTPIAGVTVSIANHAEFGATLSRADGQFDIVVNAGSPLIVNYALANYLTVQRTVRTTWDDYAMVPDVVMIHPDPGTPLDFSISSMKVVAGAQKTDTESARTARVWFRDGTLITGKRANGQNWTAPTHITVHATEYTVGNAGPQMMPGDLPPSSGYQYALALQIDEADAATVAHPNFSLPVSCYVDNFVGIPVGQSVPVGYYDAVGGAWIPDPNGRVIQILGVGFGGGADIDIDGDGVADPTKYATIGIDDAERTMLATTYGATPRSLWRVTTTHFSSQDFNWPLWPPDGAVAPPDEAPDNGSAIENSCLRSGSIIECENQTLGEAIPVSGTPYVLRYQSDRSAGYMPTLSIPLTGPAISIPNMKARILVDVGGTQVVVGEYPAPLAANQTVRWTWNRKDAYGRPFQGSAHAIVTVEYQYIGSRVITGKFGAPGSGFTQGTSRNKGLVYITKKYKVTLGAFDAKGLELGGWMLDQHHALDVTSQTVVAGNGDRIFGQTATVQFQSITSPPVTPKALATTGGAGGPYDAAYYLLDRNTAPNGALARIDGLNVAHRFAGILGDTADIWAGDGGPATSANLKNASTALAVGPDGSVYIGQAAGGPTTAGGGVRKITHADPTCSTPGADCIRAVVGGPLVTAGYPTNPTSEVDATTVSINTPSGIAVATDGTLYVADSGVGRIFRIDLNGKITPYAGTGQAGPACPLNADSCAATAAAMGPMGIALTPDGSLVVADNTNGILRKITPDGIIHRFAGNGAIHGNVGAVPAGLDGPALNSTLFHSPTNVAVGPDGTVYVVDATDDRVYGVDVGGIVRNIVGAYRSDANPPFGNGGAATDVSFLIGGNGGLLDVLPDGSLLTGSYSTAVVMKVSVPKAIFSRDRSEGYVFNISGKHLATNDALRQSPLASMTYNANGLLTSITDAGNNITTIDRAADGRTPLSITAPGGQKTTFGLDARGYLQTVTDNAGSIWHLTHDANGLLQTFQDPNSNNHSFTYVNGFLTTDTDPLAAGTPLTLTRMNVGSRIWTSSIVSQQGRQSSYVTSKKGPSTVGGAGGRVLRRDISQLGGGAVISSSEERFTNGATIATAPDLTQTTTAYSPDPRLGWLASYPSSVHVTYPSGTGTPTTFSRTESRSATGVSATNPYSFATESRSVTLNGNQTWTNTFTSATGIWDLQSPTPSPSRGAVHVQTTLDATDRPVKVQLMGGTIALDAANIHYDTKGRVDQVSQGARTYTTNYDGPGNGHADDNWVYSVVNNALGLTTTFNTRDGAGRPKTVTLPDGNVLQMTYDANGNLSTLTPPGESAHTFTPNGVDLLGTYSPPQDGLNPYQTRYTYDKDKLLTTMAPPNATVGYGYDPFGRLATVTDSSGDSVVRTYDAAGRPASVETTGAVGSRRRAYLYQGSTSANPVIGPFLTQIQATWPPPNSTIPPPSHTVGYTYDANGRVAGIAIDGAAAVPYQYDADGALSVVGNTTFGTLTVTRDGTTGPTGFATKTSFVVGAHHIDETYTYNTAGELTDLSVKVDAASTPIFHQVLNRDAGGRVTTRTDTNNGTTTTRIFDYDAAGRLHNVTLNGTLTKTYQYDTNGNRLKETPGGAAVSTYDAQDRLTLYKGVSYAYTNNGELSNRGGVPFGYDVRGNLRTASSTTYITDGDGRRIAASAASSWKGLLYGRGPRPVAELDGLGNVKSTFWYGLRAYTPDFMVQAGTSYRIVSDYLGSPRLVISMATGAVVEQLDFDEWGVEADATGVGLTPGFQPFGFTGGLYDPTTGLVRLGARDYEAATGRWTSKDRSRFGGGLNLYGYASDDPVNYIDATGRHPLLLLGVVLAAVWLALESPTHDGSVVMAAAILASGGAAAALDTGLAAGVVGSGPIVLTPQEQATAAWAAKQGLEAGKACGGQLSGYTRHGLNQVISRDGHGVAMEAIADTLRNPIGFQKQTDGSLRILGENADVALNEAGEITSAWAKNSSGWRF